MFVGGDCVRLTSACVCVHVCVCDVTVESLRSQPLIVMPCGHKHHLLCIKGLLQRRWPTPDISFNFMRCWCKVRARTTLASCLAHA